MATQLQANLSTKGTTLKLTMCIVVLSLLHTIVMVVHYQFAEIPWLIRSLFDLDEEQSFGTWFSIVLLLFAGGLLLLHAKDLRESGGPMPFAWQFLGLGFCFLSLDEMVGLHESLNTATDISWAVPGAVVAIGVGLAYLKFLTHLPKQIMFCFVAAGLLYVGGSVGVEYATEVYASEDELDTLEYNLTTVLEEAMEMSGVVLFIHGLLRHITQSTGKVGLSVNITK